MRERLIKLLCRSTIKTETCTTETHNQCAACEGDCGYCTILADYLLANGVIVLPCKIGEKLYDCGEFFLEGCSCPEIYELQDDEMTIHKRPHDYGYRFTYDSMYIGHDDIGQHIFRTREEAERALKERGDE